MVEVEWIDSTGRQGWHEPHEDDELLTVMDCLAVGYLVRDKPEGIVVALGIGTFGLHLDSMAIPREAIRAIHRLRR